MKKLLPVLRSLGVVGSLFSAVTAFAQTPVLFSLQSLTGTANNRSILVQPDRTTATPLWYSTNLVPVGDFTLQPINGIVTTNLTPWGYTIRVDGWPRSVHIVVPSVASGSLPLNVVSLINTNQYSPLTLNQAPVLHGGNNVAITTNADGSVSIGDQPSASFSTATIGPNGLSVTGGLIADQFISTSGAGINSSGVYGPGANLTGLSAGAVTGTLPLGTMPAQVLTNGQPTFPQNLSLWLNAQQALNFNPGLVDGQNVAIQDYSPSNQTVWSLASAPTFYGRVMNGRPAFLLANTELVVSNFLAGQGSNLTVFVTFQSRLNGSTYNHLWAISGGPVGATRINGMLPWIDNEGNGLNAYSGGEVYYDSPSGAHGGVQQRPFATHVAAMVWQNSASNWWAYLDGVPAYDTRIQNSGQAFNCASGSFSNLYVGSDIFGGNPATCYVSDFRVYNSVLPESYFSAINTYLCQQAGLPQSVIAWDGDSKQQGLHTTTPMSSPSQLLAETWPNYLWNCLAISGRTSQECLTNAYRWMPTMPPGQAVAVNTIGCNDFSSDIGPTYCQSQVPLTCSNILAYALCAQSNGIPLALGTITSVYWETNGFPTYDWRSNLNLYIRSLTNLARIIDYASTSLGTNGAYANTTFYSDYAHENSFGYTNLMAVAAPVVQQLLSAGSPLPGSALITDSTLRNNNGALGQAIEDYYPIDLAGPFDVASTLLPSIGGNQMTVGKLCPTTGVTPFYWDPPRWPLFQASGLTNQVLYTHIYVTNSTGALINWTASVRYFTNGVGNAGAANSKMFGSGVFQCGPGTNDYWILATNNFPCLMTNINAALFYFSTTSPSTNCWVIQGTKLRAQ